MNFPKNWPIHAERPWVRKSWLGLGVLMLPVTLLFTYLAVIGDVLPWMPIIAFFSTLSWFRVGMLPRFSPDPPKRT